MEINQLLKTYRSSSKCQELLSAINKFQPLRAHLLNLRGSTKSIYLATIEQSIQGTHLCIFPDKETAAFFFGDLEQLQQEYNKDFKNRDILFLATENHNKTTNEQFNRFLRSTIFQKINDNEHIVVITYAEALCEKVADFRIAQKNSIFLKVGQNYLMDDLIEQLTTIGFEYVDYVISPGQYTIRGGLIDVFSFSNEFPIRIEFSDNIIKSLRYFDLESQLTKSSTDIIRILPDAQNISNENNITIFDFIPKNSYIWIDDIEECERNLKKIHTQQLNKENPTSYLTIDEFKHNILKYNILEYGKNHYTTANIEISFNTENQLAYNKQFHLLINQWIEHYQKGIKNIFSSTNENQAIRLRNIVRDILGNDEAFSNYNAEDKYRFETEMVEYVNYPLHEGFIDADVDIAFYTDHQVFNRYHRYKIEDKYKKNESITLKELYDLKPGDYITHIDHGIGQYAGLEKINIGGKQQEAIKIIYKGNDVLYISIHSLHRIAKYSGKDGLSPTLTRLGSNTWNKIKEKTKNKVKELVFDLTKLYAQRKASEGFAFSSDNYMQNELEASFIYEDTPDQLKATREVKKDMEANYPMDRLICGDVGFGKTEIAIRAAFKAVCDNKQVAILVPTTILSLQHYNTFRDRLANFPCSIDYINRFRSAKEQKQVLERLQTGKLDILIGTHRLLGKDVKFNDLGLLIIDEEQKFGVGAKEKLRQLKVNVDTLTLTATPIPRTLQFSLMGARDISIMRTPPLNRYPIETTVSVFNEETLFSAIEYEVFRGGQVFVVHNRIDNINDIAGLIQSHFPNQNVGIAHGQMEGNKLEKIMLDFIDGHFDILVCTTIIESGLDIPNANTIIINEAQNYGLSELHQLRGRVGRKNKKAFCYLLIPPIDTLSDIAHKRLNAIEEYSDIGSGFNIAMRDLDIRGAGNLLGAEQSGFITEIGFEMYQKILEEAIEEFHNENISDSEQNNNQTFSKECIIETDLELFIPDTYVFGSNERFALYKTLNQLTEEEDLEKYKNDLIDRFGTIPIQTQELIQSIRLRSIAKKIGFEKIVLKQGKMTGYFITQQTSNYYDSPQFSHILNYLQLNPQSCYMREYTDKLTLTFNNVNCVEKAFSLLSNLLYIPTE